MNKSLLRATILSSICCSGLLGGCVSLTTNNYYDEQGRPVAQATSTSTKTAANPACDCCRDGVRYSNDGYRGTRISQCDRQYGYGRETRGTHPPYVYTPPYSNDVPYTYPPPRVIYVPVESGRGNGGGSVNNGGGNGNAGGIVTGSGQTGGGVAGGSRSSGSSGSRTRRDPSAPVDPRDRVDYNDGEPVVISAPADRADDVDRDAGGERTDRNAPVTAGRDIPTVPEERRGTDITGTTTNGPTVIFGDRPTGAGPDIRSSGNERPNENAESTSRRAPVTAQSSGTANPRRTNDDRRGGLSTSTSTVPAEGSDRVAVSPRVETSSTSSQGTSGSGSTMGRKGSERENSTSTSVSVAAPSSERVEIVERSGSSSRPRISGGSPAAVESGATATAVPEKKGSVEPVRVESNEGGLPDPSTSVSVAVSGASVEAKPSVEPREVNTVPASVQVEAVGGSSRVMPR